ncbi:MAG: hypothetical protein RL519_844, partial [Pseudomonadota bacterium]
MKRFLVTATLSLTLADQPGLALLSSGNAVDAHIDHR